jgi:hypothetical protein
VVAAALALCCFVAIGAIPAPAKAARPLTRGFVDDVWFDPPPGGPQWIPKTVATGAKRVQIEVDWAGIEPAAPKGPNDPTSPNDPQYSFAALDHKVNEFAGSGIALVFLVLDAPRWAQGSGGSNQAYSNGAWKPRAGAFGQFAAALAKRYSGNFPDPSSPGHNLPRVTYYQAWGEPNLTVHLAPQWSRSHGKWAATGPQIYRSLLNAFYAGVKSASQSDVVVTAGLAPFGDPTGGQRMRPAQFLRDVLCISGRVALAPVKCPRPAHYDVLAMDPYEVGSPTTHAINPDDVSAPDLGRLTRIQNKALRAGRLLPRRPKQLWVSEFGYDSNPPNPHGVPSRTQARWLEESFYVFWRQGANTVLWYLLRDPAGHNYNVLFFSGVYFHDGKKKISFQAYRFPLVVMSAGRGANVWGIAPRTGTVNVQLKRGRRWRTLFRVSDRAGGVFVRRVSASLRGDFRATVGGETSLTWHR